MSYMPENQLLIPGINTILDGTEALKKAISERQLHIREFERGHLEDLQRLKERLSTLEWELIKIREEVR